ncbi:MAG: aminopeptidase P family protein [Alphaproteobacteria bacterium]|nr:aminopeptidase P family protein [Alphaproteobacteria bacterium]
MDKELWFSRDEFAGRIGRLQVALRERELDAFLGFQAESLTWLTGYYTRAYGAFQFVIVPADGDPTIVCRDQSAFYVNLRSPYERCVCWADGDDQMAVAAAAITEAVAGDAAFAIELNAWHLTAARFAALQAALPRAVFQDVGTLVAGMRLIKSPAEIAYQRRAGKAAEAGMAAGLATAKANVRERDVAAAVCAAMVSAGSDEPGPGVMSSGPRARHLHGGYSDRVLQPGDTLQLECTPSVRNYHARFMRTLKIGAADDDDRRRADILIAVQDRALAAVAPGMPAAEADRLYRHGILASGLTDTYSNKTFYSIGLILRPSGGEPLEATPGCTWTFAPGMTFHTYLLVDGFGVSESIIITDDGYARLTNFPRTLCY